MALLGFLFWIFFPPSKIWHLHCVKEQQPEKRLRHCRLCGLVLSIHAAECHQCPRVTHPCHYQGSK